ncbi:MAG: bifunctional glutamate N-acetyltransferase/amino-acid acetyltransferase ArgJ [Pseudomonadota bacterium]
MAPVNLPPLGELDTVPGVQLAAVAAGIKPDRDDLSLVVLAEGSTAAAVFTKNAFCAAPVIVARDHLARTAPRALVINAGNANAGTGERGLADARQCCQWVADTLGVKAEEVLPFSTGVISEFLPMAAFERGIPAAATSLDVAGWRRFAHAIMTTDTQAKGASRRVQVAGRTVTLTGVVKGSGMIHPNMATMLAYIATDARVETGDLQTLLVSAVDRSFNAATVDGDTSTNDACVLMATGQSAVALAPSHSDWPAFADAVHDLAVDLAQAMVRDAEGATKFMSLVVCGGESVAACKQVAFTVAHSPLVKTAFFASDPNIGRILMAVGRSGLDALDAGLIDIDIDEVALVRGGEPDSDYTEARGQAVMDRAEITVRIALGRGDSEATVWTSDLSHDYVSINADYRS